MFLKQAHVMHVQNGGGNATAIATRKAPCGQDFTRATPCMHPIPMLCIEDGVADAQPNAEEGGFFGEEVPCATVFAARTLRIRTF